MKPSLLSLLLFPTLTWAQPQWTSAEFLQFKEITPNQFQAEATLEKGQYPFQFQLNGQCFQPQAAIKLNQTLTLAPCKNAAKSHRLFKNGTYIAEIDQRSGTPTLKLTIKPEEEQYAYLKSCLVWDKQPLSIDVSSLWTEGELVRDAYSGQTTQVKNGQVHFTPNAESGGLLLLEKATASEPIFSWQNATVYFVLTDRFENGDPSNDESYGRRKDGKQEIGTFHGGDLKGLTSKLDYIKDLGANVIWISSPLEQIHGWVGGGDKGDFPHYAYHGYYHLDWTKIDANMGTEQDLAHFVEQAHQLGIRVIFDVVMNHTGYATLADMQEFGFGKLYLNDKETQQTLGKKWTNWQPKTGQNWHSFNDFIHFSDPTAWQNWWSKAWTRADLGDYDSPKFDDLTMSLAALPDLKTESEQAVKLPPFFAKKSTNAVNRENAKVRDYLIDWLSDWVRQYGIDGFRVDTAKHVEKSTWLELKKSAQNALQEWQKSHPQQGFQDNFFMTGEAWGHSVVKSDYYQNGFDAMINFSFQDQAKEALDCFAKILPTYETMSQKAQDFNVLSYLSSHDTRLFFHSDSQRQVEKQKLAGSLLLLSPSAVQIYYGDESGREFGATGSDPMQGTRSDMNWQELAQNAEKRGILEHWQKLAQFRQHHLAVGEGSQKILHTARYLAFSREKGGDKVMVVWAGK